MYVRILVFSKLMIAIASTAMAFFAFYRSRRIVSSLGVREIELNIRSVPAPIQRDMKSYARISATGCITVILMDVSMIFIQILRIDAGFPPFINKGTELMSIIHSICLSVLSFTLVAAYYPPLTNWLLGKSNVLKTPPTDALNVVP